MMRLIVPVAAAAAVALLCVSQSLEAQRTHVIVISGLSGEPAFKRTFDAAADAIHDAARLRWKVPDSSIVVLSEDTIVAGQKRARSTRENIAAAFVTLSRRVADGDVLLVVLMGHGSGDGPGSKLNLPGPDATATEYGTWLRGFARQQVVFVNTASGGGDFLEVLRAPGRVVLTATRSAMEKNEALFVGYFAKALASDESDGDKDGRVSVLEAFRYARTEVARAYESSNRMQTEHAMLSDSLLARSVSFGASTSSGDPRVAALVAERQSLEADVGALRLKKSTMTPAAYDAELERLLVAIAEKTQAIKAGMPR